MEEQTFSNGRSMPERTGTFPGPGRLDIEEICPLCFGSGMEIVAGLGARRCGCRKKRSHSDLLKAAGLPKRFSESSLVNYRVFNSSQERALKLASELAMNYPHAERGLLLTGNVGVGKTFLAVAIIKGLVERGFDCLFYDFATVIQQIKHSFNTNSNETEWSILQPLRTAEILVLDEIGATKTSDFVLDMLGQIINSRYNDRKLTIFTTNYGDEPSAYFSETLEDRIGARLRSRLSEMCRLIKIEGRDYRRAVGRNGN